MNSLKKILLVVATAIVLLTLAPQVRSQRIGADSMSTARILGTLCGLPEGISESLATQFYKCYDTVDSSERCFYDRCQQEVLGHPLNTVANLEDFCKTRSQRLSPYITCVLDGYKGCGKDMKDALNAGERINICMGNLLGLE